MVAALWAMPSSGRRRVVEAVSGGALSRVWARLTSPMSAFVLYAVALWIWHLPALYDAALEHEPIHLIEHACFFGTATVFWWGIAHGRYGRVGYGAAVVYVFATAVHSGVLGALLTFAPHVLYAPYQLRHPAGPAALEDQQLAGLLMWIPAGVTFIAGGLILFAAWLRESDRHTRYDPVLPAASTQRPLMHEFSYLRSCLRRYATAVAIAALAMLTSVWRHAAERGNECGAAARNDGGRSDRLVPNKIRRGHRTPMRRIGPR